MILYTLMSSDRYSAAAGLLLYLKTGNLHPVAASHMDRRGTPPPPGGVLPCGRSLRNPALLHSELLKLRNTLVHHARRLVERRGGRSLLSPLPDILTDRQTCRYCPQSRSCALYQR